MAAVRRALGPAAGRVAANVRRIRTGRGMSTYDVSRALSGIGWPLGAGGVLRIEQGERRADADTLIALSIVLGVTPNALLLPDALGDEDGEFCLAPGVNAVREDAWAWATGRAQLPADGGMRVSARRFNLENSARAAGGES